MKLKILKIREVAEPPPLAPRCRGPWYIGNGEYTVNMNTYKFRGVTEEGCSIQSETGSRSLGVISQDSDSTANQRAVLTYPH